MELMLPDGAGADQFRAALASGVREGRSRGRCPRCGRGLGGLRLGREMPLHLAECPGGHGFWASADVVGELVEASGDRSAVVAFIAEVCPPVTAS